MEDNISDDLFLKYQKLASEYSKMRAQITVLKKAVTEEQAKNQEFKDLIKEKDQSVRKMELEVESLNFRNQQLAKRVAILQDELTNYSMNKTTKKSKSKQSTPIHTNSMNNCVDSSDVFDLELRNKIAENEMLHLKIHSIEQEYEKKCEQVQYELNLLRAENDANQKSINNSMESQQLIVKKLNEEKEKLETKLASSQRDLQHAQIMVENLNLEVKKLRDKVHFFEESKKILQNSFDDNKDASLIGLNIPSVLKTNLIGIRKFIGDFKTNFIKILRTLSDLHTYMEQRVNICLSETNDSEHIDMLKEFEDCLHGHAPYLRKIEDSFEKFHQLILYDDMSLTSFKLNKTFISIVQDFSSYVSYIFKLIPFVTFSLSINSPIGGETGTKIQEKNEKIQSCAMQISNCFGQLENFIKSVLNQSHINFEDLLVHLNSLHSSFEDLKRAYSAKLVIEHELPTMTTKVKNTDDCILCSIIELVKATAEICNLVGNNYEIFNQVNYLYKIKGRSVEKVIINPAVINFRKRTHNYINNVLELQKSPPPSVSYEKALENEEFIQNNAQSKENLTRQLSTVESKLANLEQSKEHWMLEAQILQVKYEREMKKVQDLENKLSNGSYQMQNTVNSTTSSNTPSTSSQKSVEANCVEFASSLQSPSVSDDKLSIGSFPTAEDDVPQVTSYLRNRIAQLIDNLHTSDSKAVAFHAECVCLQQRLSIINKEKKTLEETLSVSEQRIQELNEELEIKVKNYEEQLTTMSEHLANMNDKLTNQKDEIDALKQTTLNHKNSRKSRNK